MRAKIWGCRGSLASPGPSTVKYGGNTSCVEVRLDDGALLVLDAGTGIRTLGMSLRDRQFDEIHLLLTHLHLDHLEGLGFFDPLWRHESVIHVWGPPSTTHSLSERIARYMSPPLFPIDLTDIPSTCTFHDAPEEWTIAGANILALQIEHVGPTVGFRIEENGRSLAYMPDHEPANVVKNLETATPEWIPGSDLAYGVDVLFHDSQYSEGEYPSRRRWGHSSVADAVRYARVCKAEKLVLFHHDPYHSDDDLEVIQRRAGELWGKEGQAPVLAMEGMIVDLPPSPVSDQG